MQQNRQRKRNRDASDCGVDRELEAQPQPSQAQQNKQASGEARWDRHNSNSWHSKKCKLHTLMTGVSAAGLERGAVVASEVVEARLVTQIEAWVKACSMRALLASLLFGHMVRSFFTRVTVLPDGQEAFEDIPALDAVIPNLADRNLFLQLGRGLPPPGRQSRPSEAVVDVLTAYPDLHASLDAVPRYLHDSGTVNDGHGDGHGERACPGTQGCYDASRQQLFAALPVRRDAEGWGVPQVCIFEGAGGASQSCSPSAAGDVI